MSVLTIRGGVPQVVRDTFTTTGRPVKFAFLLNYLIVRNRDAAEAARLYFTQKDFDDDANFVELPIASAINPYGEWQGPVETVTSNTADGRDSVFIKGVGGSADVELVGFQRRG